MKNIILSLGLVGLIGCNNLIGYEEKLNIKWITPERLEIVNKMMEEEASKLHKLDDVRGLQNRFVYVDEKKDWASTIETLFYNNLRGDCEESSLLGIWALDKIDIPAREVTIYSEESDLYHSICMSNDNKIMITLNYVIEIRGNNWRKAVLEFPFYNEKYSEVLE